MHISKISDTFSITAQIDFNDVQTLASDGYKTIINCRPDGEEATQPISKALQKSAKKAGISYHYIPFKPGQATASDRENFKLALEQSSGPVLAFCRSGMRARSLHKSITKEPGLLSRLFGRA